MYTVKPEKPIKKYTMQSSSKIPNYRAASPTKLTLAGGVSNIRMFVEDYKQKVTQALDTELNKDSFISFANKFAKQDSTSWLEDNEERFFKETKNELIARDEYLSDYGYITSMQFSSDSEFIIVGHSTGLIQMRHGSTGTVLFTLRNIQFPPKPVFALEYSPFEENVCYAACTDGIVYRIEIPHVDTSVKDPPPYCIKADPMLESLNTQFYGTPGLSSCAMPFIPQRLPALSLGILADNNRIAVGYGENSIKVFDMTTQEVELTYKVHKLRLQFIPKKLQRMHSGEVVALRAHREKPYMFASGAWDETLRIWDVRCKVGCVMTFEGVNICHDSIDLNREQCIVGSWSPSEALTVWDLSARKKLAIVRAQNRRHDVDGEYIYACRYWRSKFNHKGKYGIIGGSGTKCLEVINLHNRYIACSFPCKGTILAVTSSEDRIAFGGTSSTFTIASFHDPKHEREAYKPPEEPEFDYHILPDNISTAASLAVSSVSQDISNSTMSSEQDEKE